jgi:hypothetical protein
MNSIKQTELVRVHAPAAAGSSDITDCAVIDMQGYESVEFCVGFGTITSGAVTSIHAKQADAKSSDTALTSGQDLAGTSVAVADDDDNKIARLEVYRPEKRYVQLVIKRATQNAVVDLAWAVKTKPRKIPVTQAATVANSKVAVSPAEGTP